MSIRAVEQAIRHGREVIQDYHFIDGEWRTRYFLIDPVIRALGWKTESPWELDIEEQYREGRIDYVLYDSNGEPVILIEAKALGKLNVKLQGKQTDDERQLARYMRGLKKGYGVLTDGWEWHIFDAGKQKGRLRFKHKASINIRSGGLRNTARTLSNELGKSKWWKPGNSK